MPESPFDALEQVDSDEFSPFKFYTGASDKFHHTTSKSVAFPPNVVAIMEQIVQSKAIPAYRTYGDLVRDAVIKQIKFISDHFGNVLSERERAALNRDLAVWEIERDAQIARELAEAIETLRHNLEQALDNRDWDRFKRLIIHGRTILANTGEPFKSKLTGVLDSMEVKLMEEEHGR